MSTLNAHDYTVGEILTAATLDGATEDDATLNSAKVEIKTGTYTGDGNATQAITNVGFAPIYLSIWESKAHPLAVNYFETTDSLVDNDAAGLCYVNPDDGGAPEMVNDMIRSLDADGFTVGDAWAANGVNNNGQSYEYKALGTG